MSSNKTISFNLNTLTENYIKKKNSLFRSKTLGVKFQIKKILSKNIDIQHCFQVMKTKRSNRGISDIENCKALFKTFNNFYSYISLNNNEDDTDNLLSEISWVIFHKKYKKNTLIKRPGEKNELFYLLMTGKVQKVSLVFKREKITLEEYLIYLLKMKLMKEYEILKKCKQLNKSTMNINYNNIEYFCEKNPKYNYSDLLKKAIDDIIKLGFNLKKLNKCEENFEIPSIKSYLMIGRINKDLKSHINKGPTIYLYIPTYELSSTLSKGDYFGFLNKDIFSEYSSYICIEDCDIGYINKNKIGESSIFEQIDYLFSKYFSKNKNKYYIFKDIGIEIFNNNYSSLFNYMKFKKGDKIFLQGSLNEGIYLIKDGEIKISTYSKLNDLSKLILYLVWSLKGFREHVPPSEFNNIINENNKNNEINDNISYEGEEKYFDFGILKEGDIFGLNELYNYNTSIYNFKAECISKEASLFYINKNNFNLILSKERSLYNSVIEKVELRIKYMIGTIKNYKRNMTIDVENNHKKENTKIRIYNNNNNIVNKPVICKNLKTDFIATSWNKSKDKDNFTKQSEDKIPSIKMKHINKSSVNLTLNNKNAYNIRQKLLKNEMIKSQDKNIKFNNNRYNINFNNVISNDLFKYFTINKPDFYQNYMKGNNLIKNNTYNSIIYKKDKNKFKYNFTTPNKIVKNNRDIFTFDKAKENKKDILPFLGLNLNK